jgi:hypothetical protein
MTMEVEFSTKHVGDSLATRRCNQPEEHSINSKDIYLYLSPAAAARTSHIRVDTARLRRSEVYKSDMVFLEFYV